MIGEAVIVASGCYIIPQRGRAAAAAVDTGSN